MISHTTDSATMIAAHSACYRPILYSLWLIKIGTVMFLDKSQIFLGVDLKSSKPIVYQYPVSQLTRLGRVPQVKFRPFVIQGLVWVAYHMYPSIISSRQVQILRSW